MCGISGFIDFKKNTSQALLEKMNRTLFIVDLIVKGWRITIQKMQTLAWGSVDSVLLICQQQLHKLLITNI